MNKELEELKKLIKNGDNGLIDFLYEDFDLTTRLLQELIKIPTADEIVKELNEYMKGFRFSVDKYNNLCMQEQPMDIGLLLRTLWEDNERKLAHKITTFFMNGSDKNGKE